MITEEQYKEAKKVIEDYNKQTGSPKSMKKAF
jgi:hypothetical protein